MWLFALYLLALSATLVQAAVAVVVATLTAVVGYLVARRQTSGNISTSDAATLWEAAEQIRVELREEVVARREEVVQLREDLAASRAEVSSLRGRLGEAEREIAGLRSELEARP